MRPMPVLCGHASRLVLVVALIFVASGCEKEKKDGKGTTSKLIFDLNCSNSQVNVNVNTTNGADPEVVYVCEDDTIFWNANGHQFVVEFTGESPFKDEGKKFGNASPYSGKSKHHDKHKYQLYEYRITVDGTQYDPQVLGGGKP
jgi:hypothetical protein